MASARYTLNIKEEDLQQEKPVELTKEQKRANWWDYHKWFVVGGILLLLIGCWLIHDIVTREIPDHQIALITENPLDDEVIYSLQDAFAQQLPDVNGDGEVIVTVAHYFINFNRDFREADEQSDYATNELRMASEMRFSTDMSTSESIIFITDCFEGMQKNFPIFANLNDPYAYREGEERGDFDSMTLRWGDSSLLTSLPLQGEVILKGTKTAVSPQDFLQDFSVCMRTLYDPEDEELCARFDSGASFIHKIRSLG